MSDNAITPPQSLSDQDLLAHAQSLSDLDLLAQVKVLAYQERHVTAALIAHLAVLEERGLHLAEGYSSLFIYCTQVLHLSEHAAYGRIEAARAARRFPIILEMLAHGSLTLTTVGLLAPHLTATNHGDLLAAARDRSKREVEELVAELRPLSAVPPTIHKLPGPRHLTLSTTCAQTLPVDPRHGAGPGAGVDAATDEGADALTQPTGAVENPQIAPPRPAPPRSPAVVEPLGAQRYRVQFTASAAFCDKLRLVQDLLRHQIPDGDLAAIMDRALTLLAETLIKEKFAVTNRPREDRAGESGGPGVASRHIPAEVKRAVWLRDGGRCAFVAHNGRRCSDRSFLEFHHVVPYADGGDATVENIQLRCRAHNRYEAVLRFGDTVLDAVLAVTPPRNARPSALSVARSTRTSPARAGPG